ncbi:MAG TPA: HAD-IIIA family hydrolase [Actinomycetota bacterium]|nr:HAD-IIIA family hydrolase [Actinomycetota bacterium]
MTTVTRFDVVVPTLGRPSLATLVDALAAQAEHLPGRVVLVWDRRDQDPPALPGWSPSLAGRVTVVRGPGAGPAAARNAGWRAATAPWVAFLDDDVVPGPTWAADLAGDLAGLPPEVAGSQGVLRVPLPAGRRPTDWERNVHGLEGARWITADLAYRRTVLGELGGFDERFPRAYREDADLGLRVVRAGYQIVAGRRTATHPVRPADWLVSVRLQAGNADDALMRALHGPGWRSAAGVPRGRRARHLAVTTAGLLALGALAAGRRRLALAAAAGWAAGTGELAWARIAPGPRAPGEVATMLVTSVLIPPAASWRWFAGLAAARRRPAGRHAAGKPAAVLLDRDGTLVEDVPYNSDPELVRPMPGARAALARLRAASVPTAVVSNQSGIGRGLVTRAQVEAVNRRVEELLGPLGPWLLCPHRPDDRCRCRKPLPGLVEQAAAALGVDPRDCVVIGDVGADMGAARAAGARSVLVPTPVTRPDEVAAAPAVAGDLAAAVAMVLDAGTVPR